MSRCLAVLLTLVSLTAGCGGAGILPSIGTNMSNPLSVAVNSDTNRLYVINSNYRVSYGEGSIHVVDISNPASPIRVNYSAITNFAGEVYLDTANQLLYTPNRYSVNDADRTDNLTRINVNEASADFLASSDFNAGDDPFGIVYYNAATRVLVASESGALDYYERDSGMTHASLDLTTQLSNGTAVSGSGATRVLVLGTQAVVTKSGGGLWVINLDELGVAGTYPVDYYIGDVALPRGMATDGTYIYVVSLEYSAGAYSPLLLVIDISSLIPLTDNTTAIYKDKEEDGILVASVNVGGNNPQDVVVGNGVAYVSNFDLNTVTPVNTTSYAVGTAISVGNEPFGMAFYSTAGEGGTPTHLFVANSGNGAGGNAVSAIDLSTNTVVGTYP